MPQFLLGDNTDNKESSDSSISTPQRTPWTRSAEACQILYGGSRQHKNFGVWLNEPYGNLPEGFVPLTCVPWYDANIVEKLDPDFGIGRRRQEGNFNASRDVAVRQQRMHRFDAYIQARLNKAADMMITCQLRDCDIIPQRNRSMCVCTQC